MATKIISTMNRKLIVLLIVCFGWGHVWSQCNPFYNLKEGSQWELTSYNPKDKTTGRQVQELKSIEETPDGWKALIHFKSYDKKDKLVYEKDVELECADGVIKMDMARFIPDESLQAFKDMDMTIEVDNLELPSDLDVGKTLDDGAINIKSAFMNMSIDVTDRKVEGKEKITTPAGTFDAFKVKYNVKTKMVMNMEGSGVDYIAENVGLVRSETYDKNGKLTGYTVLTMHQ